MKQRIVNVSGMKSWQGWVVVAMLAAAALACGPFSGSSQAPTPTLFAPSTNSGNTGGSGEAGFSDAANASNLTSFRAKFTLTFNGADASGNPIQGSYTMDQARTLNPNAMYVKGAWEGASQPTDSNYETTQIGDKTFVVTSVNGTPQCVSMTGGGGPPAPAGTSPDSFFAGSNLSSARRIMPDETVNGVLAQHYQFTKDEVALIGANWTNYTVDVWNAVDGGYSVKSVFSGDGQEGVFKGGQGHVDWTYDLTDINSPIDIQPPPGCEAAANASLPQMPDASNVVSFGTTVNYTTASPLADVVAFYNAQLPPLGWTAGASTNASGLATMEFTKDNQKATIRISESDGKTSVLIIVAAQ